MVNPYAEFGGIINYRVNDIQHPKQGKYNRQSLIN